MSKDTTSRRDFLKLAGLTGAASLAAPRDLIAQVTEPAAAVAPPTPAATPAATENAPMVPTRPFGKSGVHVPSLALGMMFDTGSSLLVLKQAFKWGVRYGTQRTATTMAGAKKDSANTSRSGPRTARTSSWCRRQMTGTPRA